MRRVSRTSELHAWVHQARSALPGHAELIDCAQTTEPDNDPSNELLRLYVFADRLLITKLRNGIVNRWACVLDRGYPLFYTAVLGCLRLPPHACMYAWTWTYTPLHSTPPRPVRGPSASRWAKYGKYLSTAYLGDATR